MSNEVSWNRTGFPRVNRFWLTLSFFLIVFVGGVGAYSYLDLFLDSRFELSFRKLFASMWVDDNFEKLGTVDNIFDAQLVLSGEIHRNKTHWRLEDIVIRALNDIYSLCVLAEGSDYCPRPDNEMWQYETGWEDMSLPQWGVLNNSKVEAARLFSGVQQFYDNNIASPVNVSGVAINASCESIADGIRPEFNGALFGDQGVQLIQLFCAISAQSGRVLEGICRSSNVAFDRVRHSPRDALIGLAEQPFFNMFCSETLESVAAATLLVCYESYVQALGNCNQLFLQSEKLLGAIAAVLVPPGSDVISERNTGFSSSLHDASTRCSKVLSISGSAHLFPKPDGSDKAAALRDSLADTSYIALRPK